jgi:putative transposase
VQSCLTSSPADVLTLYRRLLPNEFFAALRRSAELRENNRVYNAAVVMWLMIAQRLQGQATLESGVSELLRGLPADFWPNPCKRLQVGPEGDRAKLSGNTGSYNNARQDLPVAAVEQAYDHAFEQLTAQAKGPETDGGQVFFLDGTSLRMPHTEALRQRYPPGSSQHGSSHWPLLRMLVAHDLYTGLAMRAEWGAMNGAEAVSEQGLLEKALDRLPGGATLLGDANFGVFSVAYAATQHGHPVILRLTAVRAQHLLGEPLRDGIERRIQWRPTRADRRRHPELEAEASVAGTVIVRQVQPSNGNAPFLLALFTTQPADADRILSLYGKRWDIETDLRSLKTTLALDQLRCTNPEMVAKEIHLALMTYNLVRAVTYVVAQKTGRAPRSFGFTRVQRVLQTFAPLLAAAVEPAQIRKIWEDIQYYVSQAKLPRRKRQAYPRAVWPQTPKYPKRKE